ncbi:MAG: PAS domain S-box protein [Alphaproteobacteria bacterium]
MATADGNDAGSTGKAPTRKRLGPVYVTLGYMLFGCAYIVLSDLVVARVFTDAWTMAGITKGIAYVGVSGIFLYALLRHTAVQSERHAAAMTESEKTARRLFQENPEAMWVFDPETLAFLDVNEAAVRRYGWSRDQFLRKSVADIRPARDVPRMARWLRERVAPGAPRLTPEVRARHVTRDGRELVVAAIGHRMRYAGHEAMLVAVRDMTDLAAVERRLRAREYELEDTTARLTERVKEMRCLHAVLRLCNATDRTVHELVEGVTRVLPDAFRFPELAAARLSFGNAVWETGRFPDDGPTMRREIRADGEVGSLEIAYDGIPDDLGAPFLPEEEELVDIVAAELSKALDRRRIADVLRLRDRGLAAVPTGICITEAGAAATDRRVIYVNPAFSRISGYAEDAVLGRDCRLLQGPDTDPGTVAAIGRRLRAGEPFSGEILNYRADGEPFWNDLLVSPVPDASGRITHFVGVLRDTTDRRRAETRIRLLESAVEAAASAIIVTDADGRVEYANVAFQRITGYDLSEVRGRSLALLKSGTHDNSFYRELWERITAGEVWRNSIVNRRKDGTTYRAFQVIAPIRDERGHIAHFVAMQEDTTALDAAEEQLRHSQRLQAVGQLTGGIAHDFNNLLAVIMGNLELLEERIHEPDLRELVADPLAAAVRGAELTRRLLAFARLQPLSPASVDVKALLTRLTKLAARTLTEAVTVRTVQADDLWPAYIDEGQLETALLNVVLNARDAMPEGGRLTIETANVRLDEDYAARNPEVAAGDYVMVAVSDSGTGMTPEVQTRAFDPFFTTKEPGRGTGLGLSMVYGFAKQSAGHVRLYSEPGRGTTIRLYLPRGSKGAPQRDPEPDTDVTGHGRTVLLVEDDEQVARWIARALHGAGFRVAEARDAAAARQLLDEGPAPDLIVTDIVLPGGTTGVRLAAELAAQGCPAKVLFMSGYTREAVDSGDTLPPGAPLLTKPFRRSELLRQVRDLLDDTEAR